MTEIRIIESTNYKGVQMNKNNKSLRLTERDIEYITWIAEQQAVRLDTLQLLFEIRGKKIDPTAKQNEFLVSIRKAVWHRQLRFDRRLT